MKICLLVQRESMPEVSLYLYCPLRDQRAVPWHALPLPVASADGLCGQPEGMAWHYGHAELSRGPPGVLVHSLAQVSKQSRPSHWHVWVLPVAYSSNFLLALWLYSRLMHLYLGGNGKWVQTTGLVFFSSMLVGESRLQRACWYYYQRAAMLLPFLASKICVGASPVMKRRLVQQLGEGVVLPTKETFTSQLSSS